MKKGLILIILLTFFGLNDAIGQWTTNGNNIYNSNTGNVGIGNSAPTTLLHVAKSIIEPTITVQNLGGTGGATYTMIDALSGANWKFKATGTGGFKVRDQANALDVIVIEPNSAANAIYINGDGNVGIGTASPASSAALDVSSKSQGFLPPRMTQAEIMYIENPAEGLIVYCTTNNKFYAYSSNSWKELSFGSDTFTPFTCGANLPINHTQGDVAPVSKSVTYGTVTGIPGEPSKCWITSNLGSDHQASSVTDATEASAGWYWQFNRKQGYKHDGTTRTPNSTWITPITENSNWLPANDPCSIELGDGWRLPSWAEWNNIDASGGWTNWNGPWNSALKLHAAGQLNEATGGLEQRGSHGRYYSGGQSPEQNGNALIFASTYCNTAGVPKSHAYPARCIRN